MRIATEQKQEKTVYVVFSHAKIDPITDGKGKKEKPSNKTTDFFLSHFFFKEFVHFELVLPVSLSRPPSCV